jgi:glycosyltransferase involved in cell wall biosynthesis
MTLHDYKLACPTYSFFAHGAPCEACLGGHFHQAVLKACKDGSRSASGLLALESWVHARTKAYDDVDLFLAPSRFLAGRMQAAGIAAAKLRVLDNFVDAHPVIPRAGAGTGVVYAGRLDETKGVDVLLAAFGRLPAGAELDILGDGPQRAELEALVPREAAGRIRFHGRVPKQEVLARVRQARVAVLPARWYENQPISVLEAFACGVPVVASAIGGLPEIVEPGRTGDLVPPNDVDALAGAVARLLADAALAVRLGVAARRLAEERFGPADHLARLEDAYRSARADREPVVGVGGAS